MTNFAAGMIYGAIAQMLVYPEIPWGLWAAAFIWWGGNKLAERLDSR